MFFHRYTQLEEDLFPYSITIGLINLCLILIIIFYIFSRLYTKEDKEKKKEERINIINLITWGLFFLLICLTNILKLIVVFSEQRGTITTDMAKLFERIGIVLLYIAFSTKIIYLEYVINKEKYYKGYYFSIMIMVVIVFVIFIDLESILEIGPLQVIFIILLFLGYSIIPILYLYLAIKTVGKSRKNALKVSFGTAAFGIGSLMGPANLKGYYDISELLDLLIDSTLITGPIIVIVSTVIIFSSFWERKKYKV